MCVAGMKKYDYLCDPFWIEVKNGLIVNKLSI